MIWPTSRAHCSDLGIGVATRPECECGNPSVGFFEGFGENLCESCGQRSLSYWLMIEAVRAGADRHNPDWLVSGADWSAA